MPWLSNASLATVTVLSHRTRAATVRATVNAHKHHKVLLRIRKQSRKWLSKARIHLQIARGGGAAQFGAPIQVTLPRWGDYWNWAPVVTQLPSMNVTGLAPQPPAPTWTVQLPGTMEPAPPPVPAPPTEDSSPSESLLLRMRQRMEQKRQDQHARLLAAAAAATKPQHPTQQARVRPSSSNRPRR